MIKWLWLFFTISTRHCNILYPFSSSPEWRSGYPMILLVTWVEWVPEAFKLGHLQPFEPILFPKFFQLFHFHVGRPILITPEVGMLKMGKGNSPNLSRLGVWGIQVGQYTGLWANFVSHIFQLFHFHAWRPILFTQEGRRLKMGKGIFPNWVDWVPGTFKLDCLQPFEWILFPKFFNFLYFHAGRPILIAPERRTL